jgi:hypothetical protein
MLKLRYPVLNKMEAGGYFYEEDELRFTARSFDDLVSQVKDFRVSNRNRKDPTQDVLRYIKARYPLLVEGEDEREITKERDPFLKWFESAPKDRLEPTLAAVHEQTCLKCPHHVFREPETSLIMKAGVLYNPKISYCSLHREHVSMSNKLKAVYERKVSQNCWKPQAANVQ